MIKIYDTKLRQKVEFQPKEPGKISMYVPAPRKRDSIARDAELLLTNYDLGHAGLPSAGSGGGTASGGAAD